MTDSPNEQELAEAHRDVVERLWTEPLFDEIGGRLPLAQSGSMLVAESRCGFVPMYLDERLPPDVRIIALDGTRAMLDMARERAEEQGGSDRQIFYVPQRVDSISYADGVFGVSVCLNGIVTGRNLQEGLDELARVTSRGGQIFVALPLAESFQAFYDLMGEALRAGGYEERVERLAGLRRSFVEPERLVAAADAAHLQDLSVQRLSWSLEFDSGAEFLQSPLVRETFFPQWLGIVPSSDREALMRYLGDAIDTYWSGRIFSTDVVAGCLVATVD